MDRLIDLSNKLSIWITEGQGRRPDPRRAAASELVLYSLFARACDPVVAMLKSSGQYEDEQIIDWVLTATFGGMAALHCSGQPRLKRRKPRKCRAHAEHTLGYAHSSAHCTARCKNLYISYTASARCCRHDGQ